MEITKEQAELYIEAQKAIIEATVDPEPLLYENLGRAMMDLSKMTKWKAFLTHAGRHRRCRNVSRPQDTLRR